MHVVSATDGAQRATTAHTSAASSSPQPPVRLALLDHVPYTGSSDRDPVLAGVDAAGGVWALGPAGWRTRQAPSRARWSPSL